MTREQAKKLLPVIQAFAEGKAVQFRMRVGMACGEHEHPVWRDGLADLAFEPEDTEYRVKPEPREWWVNVYRDNCGPTKAHPTKKAAEQDSIHCSAECVHVREVI